MSTYITQQLIDDLRDFRKLSSDWQLTKKMCEEAADLLEKIKKKELYDDCMRPTGDWMD